VAVAVLPFSAAETTPVWFVEIIPATAVNVPVVLPAATVTDGGTVNAAALLDSITVAPLVFDNVTGHVEVAPGAMLAGLHVSPFTTVVAGRAIVAVATLPLSPAVMVAL
jgi:hypothetical protein